ncbi:DUF3127 domain-containing protein [Flexibacter flexilis]|nr:DUF3127 domain-containing protein [Flexibacter flexilis]
MSFKIKGKMYVKQDVQQVSEKFRKREFVLEITEGNYSEYPKFQLINDKCALIDSVSVGEEVEVSFSLKGKPFQSKTGETLYFTNLDAWRIEKPAAQGYGNANTPPDAPYFNEIPDNLPDDNLPF